MNINSHAMLVQLHATMSKPCCEACSTFHSCKDGTSKATRLTMYANRGYWSRVFGWADTAMTTLNRAGSQNDKLAVSGLLVVGADMVVRMGFYSIILNDRGPTGKWSYLQIDLTA